MLNCKNCFDESEQKDMKNDSIKIRYCYNEFPLNFCWRSSNVHRVQLVFNKISNSFKVTIVRNSSLFNMQTNTVRC